MQVFADESPKGDVILALSREEGKTLIAALKFAEASAKDFAKMNPARKGSKVHKIATEITERLPVY